MSRHLLYSQRMQCWVFLCLSILPPPWSSLLSSLSLLLFIHLRFVFYFRLLPSGPLSSQMIRMLKSDLRRPIVLSALAAKTGAERSVHPRATKWKEGRGQGGVHPRWYLLVLPPLQLLVSAMDLALRGRRAWPSSALCSALFRAFTLCFRA